VPKPVVAIFQNDSITAITADKLTDYQGVRLRAIFQGLKNGSGLIGLDINDQADSTIKRAR
jgi:hypothetical protein